MLSDEVLKQISKIFVGDISINIDGVTYNYSYKTGAQLVDFFNNNYGSSDVYKAGFPTRWHYVFESLCTLQTDGKIEKFFSQILNENYLVRDMNLNKVQCVKAKTDIINFLNKIVGADRLSFQVKNNNVYIVNEDEDLKELARGGFAIVYRRKSNNTVEKHLYEELYNDSSIVSRFRREFEITKSLQDLNGIVEVYEYKKDEYAYTMKYYEETLEHYIKNKSIISNEEKIILIKEILSIMAEVHNRNIVHRDLSPTNIFVSDSKAIIGDFGLGKNLNIISSHQTMLTNALGQYQYCDPDQYMLLKEGGKRSDVYSLGKIINFIMNKDPMNTRHMFKSVVEKACSAMRTLRYDDAQKLLNVINKSIDFHEKEQNEENIKSAIQRNEYDDQINMYISELSIDKVLSLLCDVNNFDYALFKYIKDDNNLALQIVNELSEEYLLHRLKWENYDKVANFMLRIINNMSFSYPVREIAAKVIKYVAIDLNRYGIQNKVKKIIEEGVEPLIEEILKG